MYIYIYIYIYIYLYINATKGPKYRETKKISWEKAKAVVIERLNDCIDTWCSKYGTWHREISNHIMKGESH